MQSCTDDFDIDGGAGSSQFVLQGHFVLSSISVKAAVDLQVTGRVLLSVEHKLSHEPLLLTLNVTDLCFWYIRTLKDIQEISYQ